MAKYDVYGAVVVKGIEYQDLEIVKLVGKPITGWEVAGDLDLDEASIAVVVNGKSKAFPGNKNMLKDALAYIKKVGVDKFPAAEGSPVKTKSPAKKPVAKKSAAKKTAPESEPDEEVMDGMTKAEAQKMIDLLNKKTGSSVTIGDFTQWMAGEGKGSAKKFDAAVHKLVGKEAASIGEGYARLPNLVYFALGIGPDKVGGISMSSILKKNPGGVTAGKAPAAKSAGLSAVKRDSKGKESVKGVSKKQLKGFEPPKSAAKRPAANKADIKKAEMVKKIKPALAKLKQMKSVQNYIKLSKALERMKK